MRRFRPLYLLLLGLIALPGIVSAAPAADLYVAPDGRDTWSGRLPRPNAARTDGPLASLDGARRAVRKLTGGKAPARPITVLLRGGTYRVDRPVVFGEADSGTPKAPITYAAYPGEKPVIDGGRRITGFRAEGKLWTVTLPEVKAGRWYFSQLWVNGQRRQRARTPNTGFFRVDNCNVPSAKVDGKEVPRTHTAFAFQPGDLRRWERLEDAVVVAYQSWETSLLRIKTLDTERNEVEFTGPARWRFGNWEPHQRYHVENIYEALDAPGEWYLNRQTGVLSYYPLPGERPESVEVVAPVTEELLRLEGNAELGEFVEHLNFRGIGFRHADWRLEPEGHSDNQAVSTLPASITTVGARRCAFEGCEISRIGRYAIWLRRGTKECRVVRCHLYDLGAGGVRIGEITMAEDDIAEASANVVDNNYIHHYGEVFAAGVGLYIGQSSDNRLTHNEIHDGYYSGVSVGWNWGYTPTRAHRNLIADNHIHHVLRGLLSDGAGIYTLGTSPGTVIRGNVIHDVFSYERPAYAWGIYLDAHSNQILVENNLCYHTQNGGLMHHNGAFENTIRNNIFALSAHEAIWRAQPVGGPNVFERNVVYLTQGSLFYYDARPDTKSRWNHNLYCDTSGKPLLFCDDTLPEWQARGLDRDSLVADPQFEDVKRLDFRLKPTSPAITRLGFQPFDTSKCGLYGDPAWVALPKKAVFAATVLPPPPVVRLGGPVTDGFEDTAVGQGPSDAALYLGPVAGAAVGVTEERAATGKRSLKVTDAPGLKNEWDPHFYYRPRFRTGTARARYQVWLEQGAMPWLEWRDGDYPYLVGPSLKVNAAGQLLAGDKVLTQLPHEQWVQFEITCRLGTAATGTYDLRVTVPGRGVQEFPALRCDPKFTRLEWIGFISLATKRTAYYLDDVAIQRLSAE